MEVTEQKKQGNDLTLTVKIDKDKVNDALDQAYQKVVKEVSVPGFRKGKVPRQVLEAKFGEEVLHRDALDILIPEAYSLAISEIEADPIARPDIEDFYIAKDEAATFTATVEVKPEVELGQYKDLNIEMDQIEVDETEIDEYFSRLQEEHSQLEFTDKEEVEDGDTVVIDFEGTLDGEPFEGGSAEEFNLEIGSGSFIPGFEEKLIGAKVGQETEIEVTFPADYQADDLAGQEAKFVVDIKEIKQKVKPELDDEFAKEVSDFDTIDEFKQDIREKIEDREKQQVENKFMNDLFDAIADNTEINIPDTLVENELDHMFQRFSYSVSQQGMDVEDYLNYTGMSEEEWKEDNFEDAYNNVRDNMLIEAVAEEEDISVSEEDLDEKIEEIAEQGEGDRDVEELKEQFEQRGQLDSLKENIKMEKTVEFLKEKNKAD